MKSYFIITFIVQQLAWVLADPINQDSTGCGGTEVFSLASDVEAFEINCNCSVSGGQCSWITFADLDRQRVLSNGTLFSWDKSTHGYGQYLCVSWSGDTIRSVLILPEGTYARVCTQNWWLLAT